MINLGKSLGKAAFEKEEEPHAYRIPKRPALGVLIANLFMASVDLLNANQLPSFPTVAVENRQCFRIGQVCVDVWFSRLSR